MKLILSLVIIILLTIGNAVSCIPTKETMSTRVLIIQEPEIDNSFLISCDMPIPEEEQRRNLLINRIVKSWNAWYDEEGASKLDGRRDKFPEIASYLVDYTNYYQNNRTENNGTLPHGNDIYFLFAAIAVRETAVDPRVVGSSRGEVGLFQVHGVALRGYESKEVQNNTELGVKLGIAWFADQIKYCDKPNSLDDLAGPLSVYAGGINRAKKDGKCIHFSLAKSRIKLAKNFICSTRTLLQ
jgi:hypothetical protein